MQEDAGNPGSRRSPCGRLLRCALLATALAGDPALPRRAAEPRSPAADTRRIPIVLARELRDAPPPLSLLDIAAGR